MLLAADETAEQGAAGEWGVGFFSPLGSQNAGGSRPDGTLFLLKGASLVKTRFGQLGLGVPRARMDPGRFTHCSEQITDVGS